MLIDNIGLVFTGVETIKDAAIVIDGEKILFVGPKKNRPHYNGPSIDALGKVVIPGLIDCHTHLVFAGERAFEFAQRMNRESYLAIMEKGGGIYRTVKQTIDATDEQLYELAKTRAYKILKSGITTLEAKSGYGLSLKEEIRILKILGDLNKDLPLDIHRTYLAHAIPKEYVHERKLYLAHVIDTIDQVAKNALALDCDIFCEDGAFSFDESLTILTHAEKCGLGLRAHVQQLGFSFGVKLLEHLPIKSLSHADFLTEEDIFTVAKSQAVVEILPIACLFLRSKALTPALKLKDLGVSIAIATDFNPGSAMCHDLIMAARLGLSMFDLNVEDALLGITKRAALSLGRSDIGEIKVSNLADIVITNCQSIEEIFYDWTKNPVHQVIKRGSLI